MFFFLLLFGINHCAWHIEDNDVRWKDQTSVDQCHQAVSISNNSRVKATCIIKGTKTCTAENCIAWERKRFSICSIDTVRSLFILSCYLKLNASDLKRLGSEVCHPSFLLCLPCHKEHHTQLNVRM